MNSFQHVVNEEEQNKRIDRVMTDLLQNESRSQIQKWIAEGCVSVNGATVKANYKCQFGDDVVFTMPKVEEIKIQAEPIPLDVIYEDDDLLVINKPRGMVVHPSESQHEKTLVNALLHYTDELSTVAGAERPGIVHRLDKDTAGLLVVAKNDDSHRQLAKQFKEKTVERKYEAIVYGTIPHESGMIDAPIGRNPKNRLQMDVIDEGKEAITYFEVLKRYKGYSHIICRLETGRMHQIRVHMNYIGHPLVGDPKYAPHQNYFKGEGQALFAKKIGFIHPQNNEWMTFEIEQPDYFQDMLSKITLL